MNEFQMKTKIYFGTSSESYLKRFHGERIWFVCDQFLLDNPIIISVVNKLKTHNNIGIFNDIVPDPPISKVAKGVVSFLQFQPTVIIVAGGGSAIDTAKAVYYVVRNKESVNIKEFIAIPTTSGTGSEVTSVAVVTDLEKKSKYPIVEDCLIPHTALLIPELVTSCPKSVTAYSGMDVLTHALEALVAKGASVFSDALAEKAIKLAFSYLPRCYEEGNNLTFREKMHEASCLAGLAFQSAGLGICHAISHQIGAQFHVPHGLANTMLLPHVIEFNALDATAKKKYAKLAKEMHLAKDFHNEDEGVRMLMDAVRELASKLNCCSNLYSFGIQKESVLDVLVDIIANTEQDFTFVGNPVRAKKEDIMRICLSII